MAYINGKETMFSPVINYGYEEGKEAHKKEFWDEFFDYGKRKCFRAAFGACFNAALLAEVPYTITPIKSYTNDAPALNMFYYANRDKQTAKVDISHIKFDFTKLGSIVSSGSKGLSNVFVNSAIDNIVVDLTGVTSVNQLFSYADAEAYGRPKNISIKVTESITSYSNPFHYLTNSGLDIRFTNDSVIASSIGFNTNTGLIAESAISVINALKNFVGTEKEGVYTLTFPAEVWERLESAGAPPSESTWKDYVISKGWKTA